MTEQRYFPFFVNGQFWHDEYVNENDIKTGTAIRTFTSKFERVTKDTEFDISRMMKCKRVNFRLANIREYYSDNALEAFAAKVSKNDRGYLAFKNYMAEMIVGFWVCDKELYLETDPCGYKQVYYKYKEETKDEQV